MTAENQSSHLTVRSQHRGPGMRDVDYFNGKVFTGNMGAVGADPKRTSARAVATRIMRGA